jgi:hypothetical protein
MAITVGFAAAAGCGKVTTSSNVSPVKACTDLAQAVCGKRASCTGGTGIIRANGDMMTCVSREELMCTLALAAPGTGNTPDLVEQCVAAYATHSCPDFLNGNPPDICAPAGARDNGATCTFNGQCSSAFCARNKNGACGTCAPRPAPGDSCAMSNCGHDQTCVNSTMTCAQFGDLNAACSGPAPCGAGLNCTPSVTAGSTCQPAIAMAGARCGAGTAGCDIGLGLFCTGPVGSKTCTMINYGGDGAPCGLLPDGTRAGCRAGTCYTASGQAGEGEAGTCKADAADGAPCDAMLGPGCATPARCVVGASGTAGVCTVPDATSCG